MYLYGNFQRADREIVKSRTGRIARKRKTLKEGKKRGRRFRSFGQLLFLPITQTEILSCNYWSCYCWFCVLLFPPEIYSFFSKREKDLEFSGICSFCYFRKDIDCNPRTTTITIRTMFFMYFHNIFLIKSVVFVMWCSVRLVIYWKPRLIKNKPTMIRSNV